MMDMAEIDKMTKEEQRQLHDLLSHRLAAAPSYTPKELATWNEICSVIPGQSRRSLSSFLKGANGNGGFGRKNYQDRVTDLDTLVERSIPALTRRPVKDAVRQEVLQCLVEWLEDRQIPVTPSTLLNSMDSLHHAVDRAYPGYMRAKLLHRIAPVACS